jgi:hypothetical protein
VVGVLWTIVFLLSRTSPAIRVAAFLAALSYVIFTTLLLSRRSGAGVRPAYRLEGAAPGNVRKWQCGGSHQMSGRGSEGR